ncbi:hypothetical protein MNEG_4770 [Monoraphidium neglectum]|uniref:Uncharacterized protein n=1 Tax=Monoraphidium neglectum TaxID=145388 RepID=A0A0D2JX46_9CHLO|nr:hypothetical protein MNEG_4770 [Monoraphidium neglectum]KIZ03188.1 hypothetical protein MNEG_4770 [Monoraphidium neglectum]|eukprot:XP_013902207.1 hypothetical protein MNEG_4770 [Monoraphidium neglectum]
MPPRGKKSNSRPIDRVAGTAAKRAKGQPATAGSAAADLAATATACARAVKRFNLLAVPQRDQDEAAWESYIKAREQAIKDAGCDGEYHEGADYDGQFISRPMVHSAVRTTLEGFKQLSATDRRLLLRSTTIVTAEVDWADSDDVRGLDVQARVFAVDGPNVVDIRHDYHHRDRRVTWGYGHEHIAEIKFSVGRPAGPHPADKSREWVRAWRVTMADTRHYREVRTFGLRASHIQQMRGALFTGPAGEKISKKLSDHELMTWLLAAAGYSSGYGPYGFEVRHACDGWDGVNLRRVCGAATAEDADWEEDAFEASDHSDEFGDRDEYEDEDEDGSEGGGRSEDPYGHPWYL